jgi:hypothetical protein
MRLSGNEFLTKIDADPNTQRDPANRHADSYPMWSNSGDDRASMPFAVCLKSANQG